MADSTTNLDLIAENADGQEIVANDQFDALSPSGFYGRRASTTTGLTWGYYGAKIVTASTQTRTLIANGTVALTASATNYVEANASTGAVTVNTTAFTAGRWPLYKIVAGTATITSYEDWRTSYRI